MSGKRRPTRFQPRVARLEDRFLLAVNVLTYHNDVARTGLNPNETILTPANVKSSTFGLLSTDTVDGKVDAEPLYVSGVTIPGQGTHNVLYVATENDSVYAFDADNGTLLWHDGPSGTSTSILPTGETPSDDRGSNQISPTIGITDTPVIDLSTNTMYFVAMSKLVSGGATTYFQRLHAIDITTGANKVTPRSIDSSITYPGKGPGGNGTNVIFDPKQYAERNALLLVNGVIYTGWTSHSDTAPYTGWLMAFNASDLSLKSFINIDPNGVPTSSFLDDGSGNSFWNSGNGFAADATGNVYNISANGPFSAADGDYGDSFIKFSTTGGLAVADYFTPYNQQNDANGDLDVGSSGILLLPDMVDSNGVTQQLAIGSGKDGNIYLVNRNSMGGYNSTSSNNSNVYQELAGAVNGGEWASPAYFNGQVYFGPVGGALRAYTFSNAKLLPTSTSHSATTFAYPGTTPSISSNGTTNGIVWALENSGGASVLHAYDATNLANELYNSNQAANSRDHFGADNKFITPMIANGKVYVATTTGVSVFGLLPSTPSPTVATPAAANPNPVSGTTTALSVLGADPDYTESQLTYTWSTILTPSGTSAPTFSVNGTNAAKATTATFSGPGTYTFRVTIADPSNLTVTSSVSVAVTAGSATASFVGSDTTTQGNWRPKYGADGFDIAQDTSGTNPVIPSYLTNFVAPPNAATWTNNTSDSRALQNAAGTTGIAAGWYSPTSMDFDITVSGSQTHQVALYLLDWDNYGPRSERVDVLDAATNTVLSTQTVSSFHQGEYLVWNIQGSVIIRVTNLAGGATNAVANGIFFGNGTLSTVASFVGSDTTTQGTWRSKYGADGYDIALDSSGTNPVKPSYLTTFVAPPNSAAWTTNTTDPRALQNVAGTTGIAAGWYSATSMNFNVTVSGTQAHEVSLYLLDWDNYGPRSERVDIRDAATNLILSTQNVSSFHQGIYLSWNILGSVIIQVTNTGGPSTNAVVSGIFFGGGASSTSATFVGTDTTTEGNWRSKYGASGYDIAQDTSGTNPVIPSYLTNFVAPPNAATWTNNTADPRALQDAAGTTGIAAGWYSPTSMDFDITVSGSQARQVALYLLDWDNYGPRSERIDIINAATNAVLSTQTVSSFHQGEYLVWNIQGSVIIRVTNLAGVSTNAVVNGIFFG